MTTKLSTKGQIVLPKQVRARLQVKPGTTFICKVEGGSIVLTPEHPPAERPKLVRDTKTGLMITKSPTHVKVSGDDVRTAMMDFP
jgi:AbrB family looped-hinge helix DNA binding protein